MGTILLLFFGVALGYAGITTMTSKGDIDVLCLIICALALGMILKGAARIALWLAALRS
ncbi:MAG: hypothetical protein WDA41_07410 [Candidatus Neomarinimicrobiota bacterium]|jgi:hypothetical protein|nr:hypothetical protein [Methanoregulaceae archaeon]